MLKFNHEHVEADVSEIKSKTSKAKYIGKVMVAGVLLSSAMLLSGCDSSEVDTNEQSDVERSSVEQPDASSSAIIMENGNAMIVDLKSYEKFIREKHPISPHEEAEAPDKTWILYTHSGDKMLVDIESVKFIEGDNAHKKAETIAESLISKDGRIVCFDEVETFGKTR